jgi:hypothetical protein
MSQPSDEFDKLMHELGVCVAKNQAKSAATIHSVQYRPFLLTDAILFVVKINWCSYDGENDLELFDPRGELSV